MVVVTGGAGFIGSHLCQALLRKGDKVVSVDNLNGFYDPGLKRKNIAAVERTAADCKTNKCSFISETADIRDVGRVDCIFNKYTPDLIVHLAACAGVRPSIEAPAEYYGVNVGGTLTLLEVMKKYGVRNLVFASSSSVYGNNKKTPFSESDIVDNPVSPYAASKKAGEELCHVYHSLYKFNVACLRFFTVYGPRQRPDLAINKFTRMIDGGAPLPFFGDGTTSRDYTYIDDIIKGVLGAMSWLKTDSDSGPDAAIAPATAKYDIFNLGGSKPVTLAQMVATIEKALGKSALLHKLPAQPGDVERTFADITKAERILGYKPGVDFATGVSNFVNWFLNA